MTVAASQTERPAIAKGAPNVPSDFLRMCRMGNNGRRRDGGHPPRCTHKNSQASWRAAVRALTPRLPDDTLCPKKPYSCDREVILKQPMVTKARSNNGTGRTCRHLSASRQRNYPRAELSVRCLGNAWSKIMTRNFGFHSPVRQNNPSPVWPMWVVAFVAIGVISAATLLPHH
jgi:hypothetical protein